MKPKQATRKKRKEAIDMAAFTRNIDQPFVVTKNINEFIKHTDKQTINNIMRTAEKFNKDNDERLRSSESQRKECN